MAGRTNAGLTLVEILVAVSLSTVVMALLFSGLSVLRRSWERRTQASRLGLPAHVEGLRTLAIELQSARDPGDGLPPFEWRRLPDGWALRWTFERPVPALAEASVPARVEYRFSKGAAYRTLHSRAEPESEIPPASPWAETLNALNLHFFDGRQWTADWPEGSEPVFPQAVRIHLIPEAGAELFLETTVPAGQIWRPSHAASNAR